MIRAVTFDCWGTLLLDSPAADEAYRRQRLRGVESVLAGLGVTASAPELDRAYAAAVDRLTRIWRDYRDVPVKTHVTTLLALLDPALPERLPPAAIDAVAHAYAEPALRVPPTVDRTAAATLRALAERGLALAVVSNIMRTPGDVLRTVLGRGGALDAFAVLTFSDECGIRKPDPKIFRLTLDQMGVGPDEAVHVGDDPVLDVEGARDAGMRVVQLSLSGRATGPVKPDAVVKGLAELPGLFAGKDWR